MECASGDARRRGLDTPRRKQIIAMPPQLSTELKKQQTGEAASDALVFFGATGDLAYKKIFPALHSMVRHGSLKVPVIGVANSGWGIEELRERARDSIHRFGGGVDDAAFAQLVQLLHYVDGDYRNPGTFSQLREHLGKAERPAHYLAIPPSLFGFVTQALHNSGCATDARIIVEKPFGRDLASARLLNDTLHTVLCGITDLSHRPLFRESGSGKSALFPFRQYRL